jgi:hypothetical protein
MPGEPKRVYFLVLALAGIFLAAQFHCCVDMNSGSVESHVCPVCSTVGAAIATPCLNMAMVPAINRLEVSRVIATLPVVVFPNVSPRAPPVV